MYIAVFWVVMFCGVPSLKMEEADIRNAYKISTRLYIVTCWITISLE